jgi:hypothetical protein
MQIKFRMTTLGVVVLAMGLLAGPAVAQEAQDAPEGFSSIQACQAAVRQVSNDVATPGISAELRARVQRLVDSGDAGTICTIYIPVDFEPPGPPTEPPVDPPEVGGEVIDRPATPGTPGTPATPPTPQVPQVPATPGSPATGGVSVEAPQVLGVTLSRTGADAGLLVLLGVGLLGLGAVAVRRTRSTDVV